MYEKQLLEAGIPANIQGFDYLDLAIQQYVSQQSIIQMYEDVAKYFDTTASRVERSMRHAITKTGEKITVGAFIAKYKILWRG